jgi:two-component system sensor kinase FixL
VEAELRRTSEYLEKILNSVTEIILVTDMERRIVACNDAATREYGYARDELLGRSAAMLYPDREAFDRFGDQALAQILAEGSYRGEVTGRRKDGSLVPLRVVASLLHGADDSPAGVVVVGRDVTAERRAEDLARMRLMEVAHVARLSTLGGMATEMAHELNQPLSAIASYCEAARRMLDAGGTPATELGPVLGEIAGQANRAAEVIRRLRRFTRRQEPQMAVMDIGDAIAEVLELTEVEARWHGVEMVFAPTDELPPVYADLILVEQVLLNLARNGIEAMTRAGEGPRRLRLRARRDGPDFVEVEVSDTGAGLPEAELDRVFEPFYTTKSQGMGLGLAISRTIVEAHGGRLWVVRPEGGGTAFHFTLPVARPSGDKDE